MSAVIDKRAKPSMGFIESMECLAVSSIPEGPEWTYEIKLDGFRLDVVKDSTETTLFSRRGNVLNQKFPYIAEALNAFQETRLSTGNW
jgi:ATP-dependent DNA ligase